jgi:hypothetical protein
VFVSGAATRLGVAMTSQTSSVKPELDGSRYEFERSLGQGGAGAVHLVRDRESGEQLALKKLFRMDAKSVLRLKREFRSLADMNHPNIVKLYDLGRASDAWFLTMEYLDGTDLLSYVAQATSGATVVDGPAGLLTQAAVYRERLIPAFYQLACGMAALHRAGMLHRDLKPSNVLVSNHRVVVLDFGLVRELDHDATRVTDDGSISGTPAYMAPEQALGRELSEASDWYAFGAMLYEALSGELPHDGTLLQIMRGKLESDPLPIEQLVPNVPPRLAQLCMALLQREPEQRPSGAEILSVLEPTRPALPATAPLTLTGETTHHTNTQTQTTATRLFGRQAELAQLWAAMAQAEDGQAVVVHVRGESGAGKSALVEHFFEQLDEQASVLGRSDVLLLRSRCYEREAMPYKALDGVMDALVRHFAGLDDFEVGHLLPAEIRLLTRLFPVLERVHAVQRLLADSKPLGEAAQDRKRAEFALRDLFGRLALRKPLVLWIDDLQWGDLDSASILQSWLRQPTQGSILFVFSYRSDEIDTSSCLRQLLQRDARVEDSARAVEHTLHIAPLGSADTEALCLLRLGAHANGHADLVQRIAREAQGSPYLVSQLTALAEAKLARGDTDLQALSIDELVVQTNTLLADEAKQVLAVLAVGGRPMLPKIALRAAGVRRDGRAVVHSLRGLNLVRTRDVGGERLLEVYHDRVREGVQASLNAARRQRIHEDLLRALEYSGHSDPDWLHSLAMGAGQRGLALRYGLTAAERAFATLAFQRAAELYRVCIELTEEGAANRGELWAKLALALASGSRGVQAADAYLEAAKLSSPHDALAFTRAAASHLLRCGRFERGEALVRSVLTAMQLSLPETENGLLAAIAWERARLSLRGMRYTIRSEDELPATLLANIDVFDSLHIETLSYDPLRGALFQVRSLRWALDAGEPKRVLRGLCSAANMASVSGSREAGRDVDDLLQRADGLAVQLGTDDDRAFVVSSRAVCMFMLGRPREVFEPAYEAERLYRTNSRGDAHGDYHRRFTVVAARIGALQAVGNHAVFLSELKATSDEARAADNRSALLQLMLNQTVAEEVQNCPQLARPRLDEQYTQLPKDRFGTLHVLYLISIMRAACATGDFEWANEQLQELWPKYRRSPAHRSGFLALLAHSVHARFLLNRHVAQGGGDPAQLVRDDLRRLRNMHLQWCAGSTTRLDARVAKFSGESKAAIALLRQSVEHFTRADAPDEIVRNQYALGCLVGGDEGANLRAQSARALQGNGIVDPIADLRSYFPELVGPR